MSNVATESTDCQEDRSHFFHSALPSLSTQAQAPASKKRKSYEAGAEGPTEWEPFTIEVRCVFTG